MPRSVLFIALAFPPQNSSGTFRSAKFVKYLGEFGWEPVVVTLDWARVLDPRQQDRTLCEDLPPSVPIYRLAPFNPVQHLGERFGRLLRRRARRPPTDEPITYSEVMTEEHLPSRGILRWSALLYRAVRALYHFALAPIGDEHFYWAVRALPLCARIARRHRAEVIFVSVSPWTSALLGVGLKWWLGLPLVVDFRDYWTLWPIKARRPVRDRLDAWAEAWILRAADRLICVHDAMAEDFARRDPRAASKCVVIPNGYDADDFPPLVSEESARSSGVPTRSSIASSGVIAHVGMVWGDAAHAFLEAVSEVRERDAAGASGSLRRHETSGDPRAIFDHVADERDLPRAEGVPTRSSIAWDDSPRRPHRRIRFVGGLPPSAFRLVRERGLDDLVSVEPRTTHREAIAHMLAADVLLLLITSHEGGKTWCPGKLFEYMAAGRPVLAVTPPGLASRLIEETGIGTSVAPTERERLRQLLRWAFNDPVGFARRFYRPRPDVIRQYERRTLTRRLAETFDDVVRHHKKEAQGEAPQWSAPTSRRPTDGVSTRSEIACGAPEGPNP